MHTKIYNLSFTIMFSLW